MWEISIPYGYAMTTLRALNFSSKTHSLTPIEQYNFQVLFLFVGEHRIAFRSFDVDPTTRYTVCNANVSVFSDLNKSSLKVWSTVIGNAFYWTGIYGTDQSAVLRFLSMPTLKKAQR